ncbi:ABC transporter ATP-binding protein [Campylobacter sp. RM9334]|uniref:ABC transporter ATP-binding protein n=1 Tax=Campylobacter sp. RM9334 TaxID=2735732 RepID=UPI001D515635|nr:ABC transporter ATP-binding protein [Campylobacter sp. RM9334]
MLEIKNFSFSYQDKIIFHNLNINFNSSNFIGLMGKNGCGKSTLIKCIINLLSYKGEISFKNKNLKLLNHKDLSNLISYVPQKSNQFMPISVSDFIMMGLFSKNNSFYIQNDYKKLDEIMEFLNIQNYKNNLTNNLSGGEFAKVMLARALIKKPKILLLDEICAPLDINYSIFLMQLLKDLAKDGLLILMVIHDLFTSIRFCDEIAFVKDKNILFYDKTRIVFNKENIKNIFEFDCDIYENKNNLNVIF